MAGTSRTGKKESPSRNIRVKDQPWEDFCAAAIGQDRDASDVARELFRGYARKFPPSEADRETFRAARRKRKP